mgnify:CR=1 FL=1
MKENAYYEEKLKPIVQSLPEKPGCYQYLNTNGQVIYVGKAKNLKRRVSSYFIKEQQTYKTKLLVKQIADIKYIVVNSEWDALLLENNLIKKYKPKYNIPRRFNLLAGNLTVHERLQTDIAKSESRAAECRATQAAFLPLAEFHSIGSEH